MDPTDPLVTVHRFPSVDTPLPLGRHVVHDNRSRGFAAPANMGALRTIRYQKHIPWLDQGDYLDPDTGERISLGSCVGNSSLYCLSYAPFWKATKAWLHGWPARRTADAVKLRSDQNQSLAVDLYSAFTRRDPWEGAWKPEDTGSSGLAAAQELKATGIIGSYSHAFTLEAALTAVSRHPVITGVPWFEDMFYPDDAGFVYPTGSLAGGHEICVDQINVAERWVGFPNSWGPSWGVGGRARMSWDTWGELLEDSGDVTVFNP